MKVAFVLLILALVALYASPVVASKNKKPAALNPNADPKIAQAEFMKLAKDAKAVLAKNKVKPGKTVKMDVKGFKKAEFSMLKEGPIDKDVPEPEVIKMHQKVQPMILKALAASGKKKGSFLETMATTSVQRGPNLAHPYNLWLLIRAYLTHMNFDISQQVAVLVYFDVNGNAVGASPAYYYGGVNMHSEQQLLANGHFWPLPAGTTDVVLYTTYSPCHAPSASGGNGCLSNIIGPVADAYTRYTNIHFTVIFNSQWTAQGNYNFATDVLPAYINHPGIVLGLLSGRFEMWQINMGLTKTKTLKRSIQHLGPGGPKGPDNHGKGGVGMGPPSGPITVKWPVK